MNALLDQLRAGIGAHNVLTEGDLSAWEEDWRKRVRGKALAVVRPGSTGEVAQVVRACAAAGVSIVPPLDVTVIPRRPLVMLIVAPICQVPPSSVT